MKKTDVVYWLQTSHLILIVDTIILSHEDVFSFNHPTFLSSLSTNAVKTQSGCLFESSRNVPVTFLLHFVHTKFLFTKLSFPWIILIFMKYNSI